MTDKAQDAIAFTGRNIVVFSDGTGQRGGVYFDEARTNVYKLYRATRCGPDSSIDPARQLTFYDPGLGTRSDDGAFTSIWRTLYNYVSQATGLGITHNIIDCYTAIIQLWRPGDRIYLFGFSRGAYTIRCLATALCYCGIPTRDRKRPLKLDDASARRLATRAVKSVYQHVSSPRDAQFQKQREALARQYRHDYACPDDLSAYPFFIGVFDTVAALSDLGSLLVLAVAYLAVLAGVAWATAWLFNLEVTGTAAWYGLATFCVLFAAYVYTHLKLAFRILGFRWWETVHLTTFRQEFYDQHLDRTVRYARHAISIDERRADFKRVRWGGSDTDLDGQKIDRFEQFWFAGNHADVGGGYPENESRLSDIALQWMIEAATDKRLGGEALLLDRTVLQARPSADGPQHDETRGSVFRFAGKVDRDPAADATLHPTVLQRLQWPGGVLQYDEIAPYRPEALRNHNACSWAYAEIPLPHRTCWQRLVTTFRASTASTPTVIRTLERTKMDRFISCIALLILTAALLAGSGTLIYQIGNWLASGSWPTVELSAVLSCIRQIGPHWVGLQKIWNWILALPLFLVFYLVGFVIFWLLGILSAKLYRKAAAAGTKTVTPAQAHS
jgi:uncharacterized protein (DUF2235 family)